MPRQIALARRDQTFFKDPFFADIMALTDEDMHKKLDAFKSRSMSSSALGLSIDKNCRNETAHNLQVSVSNDKFVIQLELPGFTPEDFSLKTKDDCIMLEAIHEAEGDGATSRKFIKEFKMPDGVQRDQLSSSYSADGILTISASRIITAPEGATVQEAMAAASKAYTTDDGKTSVKQDSQQASQMIAASTQSEDGSTKSSMSFSSSSSSSSTMTSSSGGVGIGNFPSLMMGGNGSGLMPSLNMGGGTESMDDMMKKMMGGMKFGGSSLMSGNEMSKKMMSSTSMVSSSSSSTSSSSVIKQTFGGPAGMQPSLGDFRDNLNIEELSTAGTDFSGPPRYTVQSPKVSVDNTAAVSSGAGAGVEMQHCVKASADYKPQPQDSTVKPDHTVLLKLKQGDEYKLVLNMQQYLPENITIKLNDDASQLTIMATAESGLTDDFKQIHKVPEGIDLDQMTSTFSSDGILVIKAPRKK